VLVERLARADDEPGSATQLYAGDLDNHGRVQANRGRRDRSGDEQLARPRDRPDDPTRGALACWSFHG